MRKDEAEKLYSGLSQEGEIEEPLAKGFGGSYFAMLCDREVNDFDLKFQGKAHLQLKTTCWILNDML